MATEKALEWAAQLWCLPETSHLDMDVAFATAIAEQFDIAIEQAVKDAVELAIHGESG